MTIRPVYEAQKVRAEIGRILSDDYPEYSSLTDSIPDDVSMDFLNIMKASPSGVLLDYCLRLVQNNHRHDEERVRNLLKLLIDVRVPSPAGDDPTALRKRSAIVSLTVTVIEEVVATCYGTMLDKPMDKGLRNWVLASAFIACSLPDLWHQLNRREHMMIFIALTGKQGDVRHLVALCRERGVLNEDFVKAYFENSSAPLKEGVL